MSILKKILTKFEGFYYPNHSLCLSKEAFQHPIHVYLYQEDQVVREVSDEFIVIGIKPCLIALQKNNDINFGTNITFIYSQKSFSIACTIPQQAIIGTLSLVQVTEIKTTESSVFYYQVELGKHQMANKIHQLFRNFNNRLFNNIPNNIYLEGNLYDQVQLLYTQPKVTSLITLKGKDNYHFFPNDLHGKMGENYFVALREGGKFCQQIEEMGKFIISDMDVSSFKEVYSFGKIHGQGLSSFNNFSSVFQFPIPENAVHYKELAIESASTNGIHRIFVCKIVNEESLVENPNTLANILNSYATWRQKNQLETSYYFR